MKDAVLQKFTERTAFLGPKLKRMILFGSRARGTERPDSDYDLLLVVSPEFSLADKDRLYDAVMDNLLESGRLVSLKIFKDHDFQRLKALETPFMKHILQEGIPIG